MKSFWSLIVALVVSTSASGQGEIAFKNRIPDLGIDAPVFDTDCQTRLAGTAFLVQGYGGLTPGTLQPLGEIVEFNTGIGAGYMIGPTGGNIPGAINGTIVYAQLRAWQASAGPTYEAAVENGGKFGFSNIVPMEAVDPGGIPPNAPVGLQSFCLQQPLGQEPRLAISTIAGTPRLLVDVMGLSGWTVVLQSSTNLLAWLPVATNVISDALWIYQESLPAADSRFYRALLPQKQ
jgi:hypothetical protein